MESHKVRLIYLVIVVSLLSSCAPKDELSPEVTILSPAVGSVFFALDTVNVSFQATDNNQLVWTSVKIVDENFIPVSSTSFKEEFASSISREDFVVLNDKTIETGEYFVLVTASDGQNEELEYVSINISALPKTRLGIVFSDYTVDFYSRIFFVDSSLQGVSVLTQPNQDVRKLCVNSITDQLTFVGHYSNGIQNYDLTSSTLNWSDEVFTVSQTQRYLDLVCFENEVFTTIYDREIRAYNKSGSLTLNMLTGIYRPESIFANRNYLVVEMNLVGDDDHFIFVYHAETRAFLWQLDVPINVESICPFREDELLLFGNDAGNAKVLHYDIADNAYWQPRQLPAGQLLSATEMENEMFAISHSNGVYAYTYSPNYLNLIKPGKVYQQVIYDESTGTILAASTNELEELSPAGQLLNSVIHTDSITSLDVHYTR